MSPFLDAATALMNFAPLRPVDTMNPTTPEPPAQTIINLSESADGHLNLRLELSHYRQEQVADLLHDLAQRFSDASAKRESVPDGGAPIAIIYPPERRQ